MTDTTDIVALLRNLARAYAGSALTAPLLSEQRGFLSRSGLMTDTADRIEELEAEVARLRRFVAHIAKQPLSETVRAEHEDEGHDGEPNFEGGYDAMIEQARAALEGQS